MKTEQPILITTILAAANLDKNLFIGFDGNLCSANAKALGVSNANTNSGNQCPVVSKGIALVLSGAAVSVGNAVVANSSSKAIPATTFSATVPGSGTTVTSSSAQPAMILAGSVLPQAVNGYALDVASGADELIRVLLV